VVTHPIEEAQNVEGGINVVDARVVTISAEASSAAVKMTCSDEAVDWKDVVDPKAYLGELVDFAFRVEVIDPRICPVDREAGGWAVGTDGVGGQECAGPFIDVSGLSELVNLVLGVEVVDSRVDADE
jgi:hypothetical protein